MQARFLGHVVWYVRSLEASLRFYRDLLGFREVGRTFGGRAEALTAGRTHHELLLIELGDAPGPATGHRIGLYHIGINIGNSLDALRAAKSELEQAGLAIDGMSDHTVSQSLYLRDPDGNEIELYVDAESVPWQDHPESVLSPIRPLRLSSSDAALPRRAIVPGKGVPCDAPESSVPSARPAMTPISSAR